MSSLLSLIKIEFSKTFSGLFNRNSKKSKPRPILVVFLLFGLLMVGLSFLYNFIFLFMLKEADSPLENGVLLFAGLASMLTFVSSINQARSIYIGDDYDLLTTLPIRKSDIIASKIFNLYFVELLFSLMLLIPNGIVIVILSQNVGLMFISFLLAIIIPILPIAVASLLSLLITMATARFKYGNFISFIFYAVFIASFSVLGFFMRNNDPALIIGMGSVMKWFNPSLLLLELAFEKSLLFLLLFVGSNIGLLIVTVLIFALMFTKLHELVSSIRMKNVYVRKDLKIKNEFKSLFNIEVKRLVNTKMHFINGIMGPLMCIVMIPLAIISTLRIKEDPSAAEYYNLIIVPALIAVMMWILSLSNPSASSISIEGKTFWISKTLPISLKKYMYAKLLITYILYIPASLITSTIIVVFFHNNVLDIVMTYVVPLIFVLITGVLGLICNVKHPKFKWKNEQEVVKNSAAILFTMLFGSLISLNVGGLIVGLVFVNQLMAYLVGLGLLLIVLLICFLHLNSIFAKRIEKMEDL